jgi:hypothetical protein
MDLRKNLHRHVIRFSWKHIVAFFALVFLIHELHETSHILTVRLHCGCWPDRDFLNWNLCGSCSSQRDFAITQIAGPVFNLVVIWIGVYWMVQSNRLWKRSLGFAMVFAALPLVRIWGNADGGGDEIAVMRGLFDVSNMDKYLFRGLSFIAVLFFYGLPLLFGYFFIANKNRILVFAGFALVPIFVDKWIVEGLLNHLANSSNGDEARIAGTPLLVIAWFFFLLVVLGIFYKKLFSIAVVKDDIS